MHIKSIGSCHLPTHRRGVQGICTVIPSKILKFEILVIRYQTATVGSNVFNEIVFDYYILIDILMFTV